VDLISNNERGNVRSPEGWSAYGAPEWDFLLFNRDGKDQEHDELSMSVYIIGLVIGERSGTGGGSRRA